MSVAGAVSIVQESSVGDGIRGHTSPWRVHLRESSIGSLSPAMQKFEGFASNSTEYPSIPKRVFWGVPTLGIFVVLDDVAVARPCLV